MGSGVTRGECDYRDGIVGLKLNRKGKGYLKVGNIVIRWDVTLMVGRRVQPAMRSSRGGRTLGQRRNR